VSSAVDTDAAAAAVADVSCAARRNRSDAENQWRQTDTWATHCA